MSGNCACGSSTRGRWLRPPPHTRTGVAGALLRGPRQAAGGRGAPMPATRPAPGVWQVRSTKEGSSMSIDISTIPTPDPTAARRQARLEALTQQVSREAVMAVLPQLVLDTMFERTNALTRAVHDLMAQPPQDRW